MKYYPAFLDLRDQRAVVIGGGKVAERKIRLLLNAGARVMVISPRITNGLRKMVGRGIIKHAKRNYRNGDLKDAFIVIAGTSSVETNRRIAEEARHLVNVIDLPSAGNYIVPSVVRRGPLTIAISTEGASPAVSKAVRKEIEGRYSREFGRYLKFVENVRARALREISGSGKREKFLKSLASADMLDTLRKDGLGSVKKQVLNYLEEIRES